MFVWIRRLLWLVLLAAAGAAATSALRRRDGVEDLAEWPPIPVGDTGAAPPPSPPPTSPPVQPLAAVESTADETAAVERADAPADRADEPEAPTSSDTAPDSSDTSADASETSADASDDDAPWVVPDDDGACPVAFPVKANDNSGIFHVPGGRFYERTKAERCYRTADDAAADGYRAAKS